MRDVDLCYKKTLESGQELECIRKYSIRFNK